MNAAAYNLFYTENIYRIPKLCFLISFNLPQTESQLNLRELRRHVMLSGFTSSSRFSGRIPKLCFLISFNLPQTESQLNLTELRRHVMLSGFTSLSRFSGQYINVFKQVKECPIKLLKRSREKNALKRHTRLQYCFKLHSGAFVKKLI